MSSRDYLIEIGLEEMPARFVTTAMNQLKDKVTAWLQSEQLSFASVEAFSTPRRLAILVTSLAEKQEDVEEEGKGPARKIAVDEEGNWTKAALGFARGQGVSPEDLFFREVKGIEYVFAKKFIKGQETKTVLPAIKEIITALHFPKNMRWSHYDLRFVRPVQWIVSMYGQDIIPIEITGVEAGRTTYGHRFLGNQIEVESPSHYEKALADQYVIVNPAERKERIRQQLTEIEQQNKWTVPVDEDLLEEVTNLVEYPTALFGSFEESFLVLPQEVLITSMREHQRYFPVQNEKGELLPYFITVRNGNADHLENVKKGNEKVLRARLSDAEFFYKEDQKLKIDDALSRLETVVYHEELGTIGDKVRRIQELSLGLATMLSVQDKQEVERAAKLCKFDLVTQMVYEFPELQGRMGEEYAIKAGENPVVAQAINEHYMPRFSGDASPTTLVGTVVSIADKIDTIVGCFSIGLLPTGSQDPYALRRQAAGIIQMIVDHNVMVELEDFISLAMKTAEKKQLVKRSKTDVVSDMLDFFKLRIKNTLQEKGIRYDVIDAVLAGDIGRVPILIQKAEVLNKHIEQSDFKEVVDALNRVTNISAKASDNHPIITEALFEKAEEQQLYTTYKKTKIEVEEALENGQVEKAFNALVLAKPVINQYFDNIMVMADDQAIKDNRLNQMKLFANTIQTFAHFNTLVFA
ncbi:glycine--tRNA ligase subunit beta [Bacillus alkalicellulosilyticus]|uniref:glycine--tRNA ligase subunit beta n=1 Tax=Alkalihalobacterium alkalicellulosilyticum TaxID=1912214 RepID=UPI000996C7FD|nr:glycine--tRNA ligase subunit beta [Bacillus alkalicellulosilyticus]